MERGTGALRAIARGLCEERGGVFRRGMGVCYMGVKIYNYDENEPSGYKHRGGKPP